MITRNIVKPIQNDLHKGKIIIVYGARQVGKSTLLEQVTNNQKNVLILNCDNYDDRLLLEDKTSTALKNLVDGYAIVMIDEAQRVKNIGLTLKMLADMKLSTQILATGSSSFDLANEINEPATGRLFEYNLYPFSISELAESTSWREEARLLEQRMIYGLYPDVVNRHSDAKRTLNNLTNSYLYKDLLEYKGMKKPEMLQKLVRALALQLGSEVSYNELAKLIGIDKETVENYINLLEKCFIIFRLNSFSRNMRKEIRKGKKIYFYDNGIRNAVISNFAPLELRNDVGALWENLMISERVKRNHYIGSLAQLYFWRTQQQQEIDLIEEEDGVLHCFEFKFKKKGTLKSKENFSENYPNTTFSSVTTENYPEFFRL